MRRVRFYGWLTALCLGTAGLAAALMLVGFGLGHAFEGTAAGVCAGAFLIPGFLFLNYWRRLSNRDLALTHAAKLADEAGVTDGKALAKQLDVPAEDATKILQTALREGVLQGEFDAAGQFVSRTAPRCASCGTAVPRTASSGTCPSCGAYVAGGG